MRHLFRMVTAAVLGIRLAGFGVAEDKKTAKVVAPAKQARAADGVAVGRGCPWGGPGMGYGFGRGWGGGGRGPGGGFGPGAGRGWGGGWGGGCGGRGLGPGAGQGRAPGGPAFVDQDNDGICDHFECRTGKHQ